MATPLRDASGGREASELLTDSLTEYMYSFHND